jgi:iron complex outermembrane receptor protein
MSNPNTNKRKIISLAVLSALATSHQVKAEETSLAKILTAPVVVTATRTEQNSFDLPVAIDVVEKKDIQDGQLQMTLSESLIRVPGITAQNRTQSSQDPQISSRGFGSRSSFGVRGIRLYVDGIPLTMPDGSGTPGSADLSAIKSIEVMRGPFSALYGNSSGGVIQLFTEDAPQTPEVGAGVLFGSFNTTKETLRAAGTADGVEYLLNYSNFETDGYRQNSDAKKEQATAKFKFNLSESTKISVLANWFDQNAQDPLGLKRSNEGANNPSAFISPKAVPAAAIRANTRVSRSNTQVGFNVEHNLNENNSINLMSYVGNRDNLQFLSTSSTTNVGRASEISRDFWGSDLRWTNKGQLFSRPYSLNIGLTYGKMSDDRTDISATGGVENAFNTTNLNRLEDNIATNFDQYIQGQWSVLDSLDFHAGIRKTKIKLEVKDKLVNSTNSGKFVDGSGDVTHEKTTPVIGAVWKVTPSFNLYANFGKGFETPTFIEVAYNDKTTGTGPNLNIKPSTSDNYEVGLKTFILDNTKVNAAVFRTNTENEIVATSGVPYAVYINAGKTKRDGVELSIDSQLDNNLNLYAAYTYLNAKFDSSFTSINGQIKSGNYIPGTYREQIYGEISWKAPSIGFTTAFEGRHNSKVYVDDINSDFAPSYTVFNLRAVFKQSVKNWNFSEYARIENLFDKEYIGSVRVNDTNGRYFEPAAGRNYIMGINASYSFQ